MPHDVAAGIAAHEVATVQGLGWAGAKNGALLRAAPTAGYGVLVTVDRNMEYQQNIAARGIALIVLRGRSTRVPDRLPAVPALLELPPSLVAGTVTHVQAPDESLQLTPPRRSVPARTAPAVRLCG